MDLFAEQYPLEFLSLGSGSSGNCYILRRGSDCVLIDLGISIRTFKRYLYQYGMNLQHFVAAFVTHDHTDHVKTIGKFAAETGVPIYATSLVHEGMMRNRFMTRKVPEAQQKVLSVGETVTILGISFTPFPVPHDSRDCVGYFISTGDTSLCIATDVGSPTDEIRQAVSRAKYVVLEANYDLPMLATGRYPQFLKDRIRGGHGHLSNEETGDLLAQSINQATKRIWLCHLSEENNTPDQALKTVNRRLEKSGIELPPNLRIEALPRTRPIEICTLD